MEALTAVFREAKAEGTNRLVLLVLANSANEETGTAFLSVKRIAERAAVSERAVQYALRKLEESGELMHVGMHPQYRTRVYRICVGVQTAAPVQDLHPVQEVAPGGVQTVAPEPKKEPKSSSSRSSKKKARDLSPQEEPIGFAEWLGYHSLKTGQSVPGAMTTTRTGYARSFSRLLGEGYSLEDFRLVTDWMAGSDWHHENDALGFDTALRLDKFGAKVEKGKRARVKAAAAEPAEDSWKARNAARLAELSQ